MLLLMLLGQDELTDKLGPAIKRVRLSKGKTLDDIARLVKVSKATISKIENSKQGVTTDIVDRIAKAMDISPVEIYAEADRGGLEPGPDLRGKVRLISWTQAGYGKSAVDNLHPGDGELIETTYRARAHTYALRVKGDSMEPKFPQGCIVIVEPEENYEHGRFIIVRQNGDEPTLKQYIEEGGIKYLKPLNPRYPIVEMKPDAVFCGVVKRIEMDV